MSNALDDLRHKLADVICSDRAVDNWQATPSDYDLADSIIAALPAMLQPLEWMDCGFEQDADFVDTTQTYQIQEGVFWYAAEVSGHVCGTNGAAMVAAQRHHAAQIMSAFGVDAGAMKEQAND